MKAVKCRECGDGFFLHFEERRCVCGRTRGAYDRNGETAWVTDTAISIGIGNGSFQRAVQEMQAVFHSTKDTASREDYLKLSKIEYAWVRPNDGPGNPHTRVER